MTAIEFIHPMDRDRLGDIDPQRLEPVAAALRSAVTVEEVFGVLVTHLSDDVPFDRLGLALLSADKERLVSRRVYSRQPLLVWGPGESCPLLGSSLAPLLEEGAVRILHDLQAYLRLRPSSLPTKRLVEEGMRSSLTLPLYHDGAPLGVLFFTSRRPETYQARHAAIASGLMGIIAQALGRALVRETRMQGPVASEPLERELGGYGPGRILPA